MPSGEPNGRPQYPALPAGGERLATRSIRGRGLPEPPRPRLLDRVRQALRARHMSRRTEGAYVAWIRRFIFFYDKRHPAEMGAAELTKFLTSLAVDGQVAASTQNQALSALLFLCNLPSRRARQRLGDRARRSRPAPALAPGPGHTQDRADLAVHPDARTLLRRPRALAGPAALNRSSAGA